MPCDVFKRLASTEKYERKQYSYFTFNKHLHGQSDRKARHLAKEAMEKSTRARNAMFEHQKNCGLSTPSHLPPVPDR
jgi:hypothetical protein